MNAQTRRAPSRSRKGKVVVPKRVVAKLPVDQDQANSLARGAFALFVLAMAAVAIVALDLPAKAGNALGASLGRAGFAVDGYQIVGLNHLKRAPVDAVVTEELHRAAEAGAGSGHAPEALVDVN